VIKVALMNTTGEDKNNTAGKAANYIMWHTDPLLGNDRKITNYTTPVFRQRLVNSNGGRMFSTRFVPICYTQGQLAVAVNSVS
jgi:hypothetical protein